MLTLLFGAMATVFRLAVVRQITCERDPAALQRRQLMAQGNRASSLSNYTWVCAGANKRVCTGITVMSKARWESYEHRMLVSLNISAAANILRAASSVFKWRCFQGLESFLLHGQCSLSALTAALIHDCLSLLIWSRRPSVHRLCAVMWFFSTICSVVWTH